MSLNCRMPLSRTVGVATRVTLATVAFLTFVSDSPGQESPKAKRTVRSPNAAVIYWQAFAAIPTLKDDDRKTLDAATASTSAPWSAEIGPILARHRVALRELHRAAAVAPCDWQLDLDAGPNLLLPHLQKARELSRIALLHARVQFMAGDTDAAIDEVLAVKKMARDCGASPILIALLVEMAIEKSSTEVLAAHLPQFNDVQLGRIESALAKLSPPVPLTEIVQAEEELFGNWLARTLDAEAAKLADPQAGGHLLQVLAKATGVEVLPATATDGDSKTKAELIASLSVADVRRCVEKLRSDYQELAVIAALPLDQRNSRAKAFEASLEQAAKLRNRDDVERYFSTVFLPKIQNVLSREEQYLVRIQLLSQAVQVQRTGPSAVQPILGRKVVHERKSAGFELRCPTSAGNETVVVGK